MSLCLPYEPISSRSRLHNDIYNICFESPSFIRVEFRISEDAQAGSTKRRGFDYRFSQVTSVRAGCGTTERGLENITNPNRRP